MPITRPSVPAPNKEHFNRSSYSLADLCSVAMTSCAECDVHKVGNMQSDA